MNPNNELDRQRLMKAIENSTRVLRPFRDVRKRLVKDFAGSYYGQSGSLGKSDIIMNLMYQTAETYTMALAANRPRVLVTAQRPHTLAHVFVVPTPPPGRRARKMGGLPKALQPPPKGAKMGAVLNNILRGKP
jgi:hypothetical protein